MNEPFLASSNLGKIYWKGGHEVIALRDVQISVPRGGYMAVVGSSGSGKTTLLNLLGGIDRPTSGQILFEGRNLNDLAESELSRWRLERVGLVFQDFCLVSGLNCLENVELPFYLRGRARGRRERARQLIEELGMADRARHYPRELSRGESQRVALARALVHDPDLLLLDEPTGSLDEQSARLVRDLLSRQNREGKTVVLATHDPSLAREAAESLSLSFGRILGDGGQPDRA